METIRALCIDDEPASRASVRVLLQRHHDVELVGECETGSQIAPAIANLKPNLLFVDINLPEQSGITAIEAIPRDRRPTVIFVTAYHEHAVHAFEIDAADYLLKPYSDSRFDDALRRARRRLDMLRFAENHPLTQVANADLLGVRSGNSVKLIPVSDIEWLEAAGDYVRIHTASAAHLTRATMLAMENRLDPRRFVRIHRATIVNVGKVVEVRSPANGEPEVVLSSGSRRRLSENGRDQLERVLKVRF